MSKEFTGYSGPTFDFMKADLDSNDFQHSMLLVGVSGITMFGHGLLCVRDYYFHVDEAGGIYPKWMQHEDYKRYIHENKKMEWFRIPVRDITRPQEAMHELKKRLKKKYIWTPVGNNCVSFAEYIFEAGGSKYSESNLPGNLRKNADKIPLKTPAHLLL